MVKPSNRWKNSDTCSIKSYEYPVDLREPLDYDKFLILPNIVRNAGTLLFRSERHGQRTGPVISLVP